jgi:hypothetical protein
MSRQKNKHGSRTERENALAAALGLGTGRTMMGALISAYESGATVSVSFIPPGKTERVRYMATYSQTAASDE